jgi:hypothetical protein
VCLHAYGQASETRSLHPAVLGADGKDMAEFWLLSWAQPRLQAVDEV